MSYKDYYTKLIKKNYLTIFLKSSRTLSSSFSTLLTASSRAFLAVFPLVLISKTIGFSGCSLFQPASSTASSLLR
jgi:hypothetical protein